MTTEDELILAMDRAAESQTPENMAALAQALGDADGFLLSDHGTPLAPNPRALTTKDGRVWVAAFTSAERAARTKPPEDGILRAPMPVICATGRVPGFAGVILNPRDAPWMLIEGGLLERIATTKGSGHPIAMVDPRYPATALVGVGRDGNIAVDGHDRTLAELREDLVELEARHGLVQYTRAAPLEEPSDANSAVVKSVIDLITELRLPVSFVEEASPAQLEAARMKASEKREPPWRRWTRR